MRTKTHEPWKKRPGPDPEKVLPYPLDFDEAVNILVGRKQLFLDRG